MQMQKNLQHHTLDFWAVDFYSLLTQLLDLKNECFDIFLLIFDYSELDALFLKSIN